MNKDQYVKLFTNIGEMAYDALFEQSETELQELPRKVPVRIVYMDNFKGEKMKYQYQGDSGFDLRAAVREYIMPKSSAVIPTGIKVAVPLGLELQVRTRSGSPLKRGFFVANSPGTVDAGYRGEVGVIVRNLTDEPLIIEEGERIAQAVLCPIYHCDFQEVIWLDETDRGEGAYNSTGTK